MSDSLDFLYQNGPTLVLNKPPGLLTQAPPGIDSLEIRIKAEVAARERIQGNVYLAIIHRLDRPASGAIVFSRDRRGARKLSHQFQHRRVQKTYWAFVEGRVEPEEGQWVDHLYKIHGMAQAEVVDADHPGGKQAILNYIVRWVGDEGTWLEIELETGRTHQIRVQAASRGHPILGDFQYGAVRSFGAECADPRDRAIALHARALGFTDPHNNACIDIIAPLPAAWDALELDFG